ncbi:MAG TPA: catalase [Nocardioides sp.]|nr:catalase [Nocardioides sp.]
MLDAGRAVDRLRAAFGGPDRHRALHAKGRFYAGTFTAMPEAGTLGRAGHLAGDPVPVLVRWSNAGGNAAVPDKAPDIRGMAVKFRLPDGTETDLLGQTSPRFPTDSPEEFVALTEASRRPALLPLFLLRHPRMVPATVDGLRHRAVAPHTSFTQPAYYPIHAYGWRDRSDRLSWVRYTFVPQPGPAPVGRYGGPDRLFDELAARLAQGPVRFDVRVQVAGADDDPHSAVSVWKHARDLLAGTIEVTEELPDQDPVVFDPTRVVDGIELSDDPILRYRPSAYSESISRRT